MNDNKPNMMSVLADAMLKAQALPSDSKYNQAIERLGDVCAQFGQIHQRINAEINQQGKS